MALRRAAYAVGPAALRLGAAAGVARKPVVRVVRPVVVSATVACAGAATMSLWAQPDSGAGASNVGPSATYRYRPEPSCELAAELRRTFVTLLPASLQQHAVKTAGHKHKDDDELGAVVGPPPDGEDPRLTQVLEFWFRGDPGMWWRKDPELDLAIKQTFLSLMQEAQEGRLTALANTPRQALAIVVVLDQFSRNVYRDSPKAFAFDELARSITHSAVKRGFDTELPCHQAMMLLMPLMHSEDLADHELLEQRLEAHRHTQHLDLNKKAAHDHKRAIEDFGRFPHRNKLFGRVSSAAEEEWLAAGGGW